MDSWKRFNETLLPDKEDFHSYLNMEKLQMLIISTLKKYGKSLKRKILVVIMICTFKATHFYSQMCLNFLQHEY